MTATKERAPATIAPPETPATPELPGRRQPTWALALASFLPASWQDQAARGWVKRTPLFAVLVLQAILSLRLSNSAFQDEAEYLYVGDLMHGHQPIFSAPSSFFSGAPQLYPYFAGYLDSLGGIGLARAFSTVVMLSATVSVYWTASVLFEARGRRAGLFAALVFSLSAPVVFLGHFATFDASSFACIAWATALTVWASKKNRSLWWSLPVGGFLFLGVALKYASAIDVPFVLLLSFVGWPLREHRVRTAVRGVLNGAVAIAFAVGSALTWARADLVGLRTTTLEREPNQRTAELTLWRDVFGWTGVTLALMLLGGLFLLRSKPVLASFLIVSLAAATAVQIHSGEATSLQKHVTLGLVLGAPLAGYLLAELWSKGMGAIATMALLWLALMFGLVQSATLFSQWPNSDGLVNVVSYSVRSFPTIRILGETPEPVELGLRNSTQVWQWYGTYADGFVYKNQTGESAMEQALEDNYIQLVFLDGSSPVGRELAPKMSSLGFTLTQDVVSGGTGGTAPHVWHIWQRFDGVGE